MYTITFYSYKGGVGRSLLVANAALHLAQLGFRVVALDLDLEAPGLHYKFRPALPEGFVPERGIVDLIDDYVTRNELYTTLEDVAVEVPLDEELPGPGDPRPAGRLHVIPAGSAPSSDYWRRVSSIDWKRFFHEEGATGVEFFVDLRDRIAQEFSADILLIDSRTGITEMGNVATTLLADKVVCIVADTLENLEGARAVLRGLEQSRRLTDGAPIEMTLAVSRPHASQDLNARLERIRVFFEEPAELLDATIEVGTPYPLSYSPEVEEQEHLMVSNAHAGMSPQLYLDYIALIEEMIPEPRWERISKAWTARGTTPYAHSIRSYVTLALQQPELELDGLYRRGRRCYIVVPGFSADMKANDGQLLSAWFAANKVLSVPIDIVSRPPEGAERVPEPSLEDLIELRDFPHTMRQIDTELCLALPRSFPRFHLGRSLGVSNVPLEVERALRADERTLLWQTWASLGLTSTVRLATHVDPDIVNMEPEFRSPNRQGDTELIPCRRLPASFSSAVRELAWDDEQCWMSSRHAIYRGDITEPSEVLPSWHKEPRARFYAGDIRDARRLLPFCDELLIDLPLREKVDSDLHGMGFTREELIVLARDGRVRILLPQALDRYEPNLLNELAAEAPRALVLSRSLCAATMIELRRRLYPWFFPDFDFRERYERLHRAIRQASTTPFPALHPIDHPVFVHLLSHIWSRQEILTHQKGAMAFVHLGGGTGTFLAEVVKAALKRDLFLESSVAGYLVERAAALSAAIVPTHRPEFSLAGLTTLGAAWLSSWSGSIAPDHPRMALQLPSSNLSALDLAELDHQELRHVRELIASTLHGKKTSSVASTIEACNRTLSPKGESPDETGSLILEVPALRRDEAPDTRAAMQAIRELLAGGTLPDELEAQSLPGVPSIVVGTFDPEQPPASTPRWR